MTVDLLSFCWTTDFIEQYCNGFCLWLNNKTHTYPDSSRVSFPQGHAMLRMYELHSTSEVAVIINLVQGSIYRSWVFFLVDINTSKDCVCQRLSWILSLLYGFL